MSPASRLKPFGPLRDDDQSISEDYQGPQWSRRTGGRQSNIGQDRLRRVSRCARVQRRPRRSKNADGPEDAGRIRQPQFPGAFGTPANITSTVTGKAGDPVNDDVVLPVLGLAVV